MRNCSCQHHCCTSANLQPWMTHNLSLNVSSKILQWKLQTMGFPKFGLIPHVLVHSSNMQPLVFSKSPPLQSVWSKLESLEPIHWQPYCCAPLHEESLKHHGHKGNPKVTPGTCGAVGERAPGVGNASHPWRLGCTRVRPWAMRSSWRGDSRMLKITSIGGVS